jgi:hypothetical protein
MCEAPAALATRASPGIDVVIVCSHHTPQKIPVTSAFIWRRVNVYPVESIEEEQESKTVKRRPHGSNSYTYIERDIP